jgi:methyltransferase (TIGR00027 family)
VLDDFFLTGAADRIRQAVILAAGLDTRVAARPGVVYEIDQPKVLAFKLETLESHDVATIHVSGGMDLWKDWPKALADAGFDPSLPLRGQPKGSCPI